MRGLKRICFLLPNHFSSAMGGAEYQVMFVLDSLCKKSNYDISYLCRHSDSNFISKSYKIYKVGNPNGLRRFGFFFDTFSLYKTLKAIKPHIIYQNIGCAYTGIAARFAKKFQAKLIFHISSDNNVEAFPEPNFMRRLTSSVERLFLNYGIRNADIIAGQTKHQNDLLKKNFGRKCDVIIPIGHPFPKNKIKKSHEIKVLWLANLKAVKQPEIFIRLARELEKTRNTIFMMMGRQDGSIKWRTEIMELIKSVKNLKYLGEVSQDEANRHLSEGHVLVNTSRYEGFSNTFIQAWMRRVPVVSLNSDPDHVLVRENIGFRSGNFTKLCRDVKILIENEKLRDKMGLRAQSYAKANHTVEKMVYKVINLF